MSFNSAMLCTSTIGDEDMAMYCIFATSVNLHIQNFSRAIFTYQSKGLILTRNKNLSWTRFFTGLGPSKFTDVR